MFERLHRSLFLSGFVDAVPDDRRRRELILIWSNLILGGVSVFMAVVNLAAGARFLLCTSTAYALACFLNVILARRKRWALAQALFLLEGLALCAVFCVSGEAEGVSVIWICFIPSFSLTLLGNRWGSVYSGAGLLLTLGLFWTAAGRSALQYNYTESFLLRFPMIYCAFYLMALCLEAIRAETQRQLTEAEQRYQHLYMHDALTGLYNRYGFNERFNEIYASPDTKELALLMLDLDLFKNVNDTYGHDGGDAVLRFTADTLRRLCGDECAICRWGGEEFTVLLWDGTEALPLAERICREFRTSGVSSNGRQIHVTVSIGVCVVEDPRRVTIAQIVKNADRCLYQVKGAGRNGAAGVRL